MRLIDSMVFVLSLMASLLCGFQAYAEERYIYHTDVIREDLMPVTVLSSCQKSGNNISKWSTTILKTLKARPLVTPVATPFRDSQACEKFLSDQQKKAQFVRRTIKTTSLFSSTDIDTYVFDSVINVQTDPAPKNKPKVTDVPSREDKKDCIPAQQNTSTEAVTKLKNDTDSAIGTKNEVFFDGASPKDCPPIGKGMLGAQIVFLDDVELTDMMAYEITPKGFQLTPKRYQKGVFRTDINQSTEHCMFIGPLSIKKIKKGTVLHFPTTRGDYRNSDFLSPKQNGSTQMMATLMKCGTEKPSMMALVCDFPPGIQVNKSILVDSIGEQVIQVK